MAGARSKDVKFGLVRFAFTQTLFKPGKRDDGTEYWGCSLLWPKSQDYKILEAAALSILEATRASHPRSSKLE